LGQLHAPAGEQRAAADEERIGTPILTNAAKSEGLHGPMGQFANAREYPTAAFKDVTAPNADTLYSSAWLDLSNGPYILHVPDEHGRYYLMPMLEAWTNVFADPGTRTTGTGAGDFAMVRTEEFTVVGADRPPLRFSTINCPVSNRLTNYQSFPL
jgi:hypothetical protein